MIKSPNICKYALSSLVYGYAMSICNIYMEAVQIFLYRRLIGNLLLLPVLTIKSSQYHVTMLIVYTYLCPINNVT